MYSNIIISGTGISYPKDNVYTKEDIENHFKKRGIRIKSLMSVLGKEKRYSIDKTFDCYSLVEEAANEALEKANINADEIDLIIFATDTPEFLAPTNAVKLARIIDAKNVKLAYDINGNCSGGVLAIDQAYRYLRSRNDYNKVLVCTMFFGSYGRGEDEVVSAVFSDSAAAVVLEKKDEEASRGIIDSVSKVDYMYNEMGVFPRVGFKNVFLNNKRSDSDLECNVNHNVDPSFTPDVWKESILELLEGNGLEPKQISKYLFSQFSLLHIKITMDKLLLGSDKYVYVGDKYGYNGCCSPIFALDYSLKENLINKDDYVVFCSIGAGYLSFCTLYKF